MSIPEPISVDAVDAAFKEFIAAFNALDAVRFARCFEPDSSLFAPDGGSVMGRIDGAVAIHEHFTLVFAVEGSSGPNIQPVNVLVRLLGEQAALVTFEFARTSESLGRRTLVFLCNGNQEWKVAHVHASNTAPRNRAA